MVMAREVRVEMTNAIMGVGGRGGGCEDGGNNGMEMDGIAAIKDFSILTSIRLVRLRLQRLMCGRSCEEADRV